MSVQPLSSKRAKRSSKSAQLQLVDDAAAASREAALYNYRFVAGSLAEVRQALHDLLCANLSEAGAALNKDNFSVEVTYSAYCPTMAGGHGSLYVKVKADWATLLKPVKNVFYSFRDLTQGLKDFGYSVSVHGSLHKHVGAIEFSLELQKPEQPPLMFVAALDQERALSRALEAVRQATELSEVARAMRASGEDKVALEAEKELEAQVQDLEERLEEARKEHSRAKFTADQVRERLRNTETPHASALRAQVEELRAKVGLPVSAPATKRLATR